MIHGYAAEQAKAALTPFAYEPKAMGPHDIEIEISHCGICFSDAHLIDDDWKRSIYPFIPGHEIIGKVRELGSAVKHLHVGDRVGVGWQRSACLECEFCREGNENLCAAQTAVCVAHHGGFADRIRTDSRFAFLIPASLESAATAPLLCGGATVFAPIMRYGIHAKSKVGVIGIGGLGHMALLFLKAIGCEITAFSSSESKRAEARQMGAHRFVSSTQPKEIAALGAKFDLILSTVHAKLDWMTFLQAVKPGGVFCLVGAPPGFIQFLPGLLVGAQRTICGSDIASRETIIAMLKFAEKHKIAPIVETAPMREVNAGMAKLRANQVRYRMVLEN
jgi:uncharacterized zinc-type alcohol dehydrogenase-like protein